MLSYTETVLGDVVPYIREDVGTVTKLCDVHNELLITAEKEFAEIERYTIAGLRAIKNNIRVFL